MRFWRRHVHPYQHFYPYGFVPYGYYPLGFPTYDEPV